jgi:hypothetical protein
VSLLGEPSQPRRSGVWVSVGVVAVILVAAAGWLLLRRAPPETKPSPTPAARRTPAAHATASPTPAPVAGARTGTLRVESNEPGAMVAVDGRELGEAPQALELPPGSHRVRVTREGFEPWELEVHVVPGRTATARARLAAEAARLRIDADVPGASVFLDRRFLGTTPVETRDVAPGTHRLNVSAEGYEMYAETLEVGKGRQDVMVRFKEVRLDEKLPVVHKHGMGSCRGTLLASPTGLRYETDGEDGFQAPFSALEPLQIDYLKKNLRVRLRGGKTYNFTAETADPLLSFQKAVEAARKKL